MTEKTDKNQFRTQEGERPGPQPILDRRYLSTRRAGDDEVAGFPSPFHLAGDADPVGVMPITPKALKEFKAHY